MRLLQPHNEHARKLLWGQAGARLLSCGLWRYGYEKGFRIWDWLVGSLLC